MKKTITLKIFLIFWLASSVLGFISGQMKVISPLQNLYYHISDDDGTTPIKDTDVILLFEPDGSALVYVQSTEDQIANKGTWSYQNGQISLQFKAEALYIDSSFPIDLQQDVIEMPFRLFSSEKGSSQWKRFPVILEQAMRIVFRGEVLNSAEKIDADSAIKRTVDYGNAVIQTWQESLQEQIRPVFSEQVHGPSSALSGQQAYDWPNLPKQVRKLKNGIEVEYRDGRKLELLLFSWAPPPPGALALTPKRLVNDPRVHLNAEPSKNTTSDPDNKTVLFISPFNSNRIISWFDGVFNRARESGIVPKALANDFTWDQILTRLKTRGYSSETLLDNSVTVEKVIDTITELKDPGIVIFYTHGTSQGTLCTGEQLTETNDPREANLRFDQVRERLIRAGHRRLVENEGIGIMSIELGLKVVPDSAWFVTIKPYFWQYLQSLVARPVSFKKSLFFTAACYTDDSPFLRDAIQAKAYFAWKVSVSPDLNGAVCLFLIESLARYTRSAEEAYYNLVRVVNTREIICKEDRILQGKVPVSQNAAQSPLFQNLQNYLFNGYGLQGNKLIRYAGNGWLAPKIVDVGQVWWLVFAGRWGQSAQTGADNLKDCYQKFWSKGSFGRLKSAFCNAANIGKIPTKADVAYACYLLTGEHPDGYSGQVIPRWTLNEMR
ncbi:MAG: hypothetical protein JW755_02105 [Candidatus Aminicenantes bacterium]|nr:hypothetical protein [Candidatus Aminicenantes bacterium]